MKIKLAVLALLTSSCATGGDVVRVNVDRNYYYENESKSFRDPLIFACESDCDVIRNPAGFEEAVVALRKALPKDIISGAVRAFRRACNGAACETSKVDFWFEFYREVKDEPYDKTYSVYDYLIYTKLPVAELWRLGYSCPDDAALCKLFAGKFWTSAEMKAEIILRAAIMQAADVTPVLDDVVAGMGDMIEPPRRTVQ